MRIKIDLVTAVDLVNELQDFLDNEDNLIDVCAEKIIETANKLKGE